MASRTKRPPAEPVELKASPDGCAEASTLSRECYIPCNRPAKWVVGWTGCSEAPIRMCDLCADHNVKNRGGFIAQPYIPAEPSTSPPRSQWDKDVGVVRSYDDPKNPAAGHNSQVTDFDLIAENHKLEDQLKAGLAKYNEWAKPHKERIKAIEDDIFKRLVERGADQTKTDAGTAYISRLESVQILDNAALFDFAAENWDKYGDDIKLSIGIKAVRQYMEENNGQLPPGIGLSKYSRLNINRS